MEPLLDVLGAIVFGFLGAIVGVLWPPRSRSWATAQKAGIAFFCGSVVFGVVAYFARQSPVVWGFVVVSCVLFGGFLIVGNICRVYHERHHEKETRKA